MVLDPLSALSLTGNVLQLIEFSLKILTKGKELRDAKDGMLAENRNLRSLAEELKLLNGKLDNHLGEVFKYRSGELDEDDRQIQATCRACNDIASELILRLEKIRSKETRNPFVNITDALVAVWSSKDVEEKSNQLRVYKEQLQTQLLVSLRRRIDLGQIEQTEAFASLDQSSKEILRTMKDNKSDLSTQMENMTVMLSDLVMSQHLETREMIRAVSPTPTPVPAPPAAAESQSGASSKVVPAVPAQLNAAQAVLDQIQQASQQGRPYEVEVEEPAFDIFAAVASNDLSSLRRAVEADKSVLNQNYPSYEGQTPLHAAARTGNKLLTQYMLRNGAQVDVDDDKLRTPLHYAAEQAAAPTLRVLLENGSSTEVVDYEGMNVTHFAVNSPEIQWILQYGFDINATNDWGQTALYHFTVKQNASVVQSLLEQRADTEISNKQGLTPLMVAAKHDFRDMADLLLNAGANVERRCSEGTALVLAAARGHGRMVRKLLDRKADIHAVDAQQRNALEHTLACHRERLACTLIERGADLKKIDATLLNPFHSAAHRGLSKVLEKLVELGQKDSPLKAKKRQTALMRACSMNRFEAVRLLLSQPSNQLNRITNGRHPLACAVEFGNAGIVRLLLESGADIHLKDDEGRTPLLYAAEEGHQDVCKVLIEFGAQLEDRDSMGRTPLIRAAQKAYRKTVLELLRAGADPNAVNKIGANALLMSAAHGGYASTVRSLIGYGCKVNKRESGGMQYTPLCHAAWKGRTEIVHILIDEGDADVNVTNRDGMTPLMEAAKHGNKDIVIKLLNHGADITKRTVNGKIALTHARENKHNAIANLLIEQSQELGLEVGDL